MCGIAGYFGGFHEPLLDRMGAIIAHRGPDDRGEWLDPERLVGLAHRRLSILDTSSGGHQPMSALNGAVQITYNGEIYNFRELARDLEAKGHTFLTRSDTEVLLAMYLEHGTEMMSHLNGMFAFALWDARERQLLLARDHLGVKPLYYTTVQSGFLFASELKALLLSPEVDRRIDPVALDQHLAFGWTTAPRTIIDGINKLEPGHALVVKDGRIDKKWRYYDIPYGQPLDDRSESSLAEELRHVLESAVERQMVSDVPVGAFLSGGLDSSAVVAMMRLARPDYRIPCYTIGFEDESDLDGSPADLPYARRVAGKLEVDLKVVTTGPDMIRHLDRMLYHLDEPQGDPAPINAMLIAQRAQADGIKVLLSGAGGDDIFSGYRRHHALRLERAWGWLPRPGRGALTRLSRIAKSRRIRRAFEYAKMGSDDRLMSYFLWSSDETRMALYSPVVRDAIEKSKTTDPLKESLSRIPDEPDRLNRMLYLETKHFLADHNLNYTDKMAMAHGVEVRVPLIDPDLVAFAARVPPGLKQRGSIGKHLFKKAMEPFLDHDVIYRPKTGFGAPLRRWLRNELAELMDDVLDETSIDKRGVLRGEAVRRLIEDDRAGRIDATYTVFSILCFELWCRTFIDQVEIVAPPSI